MCLLFGGIGPCDISLTCRGVGDEGQPCGWLAMPMCLISVKPQIPAYCLAFFFGNTPCMLTNLIARTSEEIPLEI